MRLRHWEHGSKITTGIRSAPVGHPLLPPDQRDRHAGGLILAFTDTGLEAEEKRLRSEGVDITMPLREEPWGERLFQVTDPNGVVVQLVEWITSDHA
ncbi:VOC family protein [Streptomyces collinus]|uniref:VOC family protein n=1 Tax=Streptomyces collinus TaxID=42684 RepID=UPI0033C28538